jgi:adenylate cyclase
MFQSVSVLFSDLAGLATFNSRGDQLDHAVQAAGGALALQRELTAIAEANPGWPRLRVGLNSGLASVREMGGDGFVAYVVVGDTVNTASRLESEAPDGGVLIGTETTARYPTAVASKRLPDCASRAGRRHSTLTSCTHCRP